ncbi:MAG: hypothetical protein F6K62_27615 [Sphaerospermopsis sp. SIO1G2]|nr:hypothetical protein [Sphaerospermopsis sp. SIO1G2]
MFQQQTSRAEKISLFLAFVGFGISDFLEIQTGAWWRPWWLFTLKAICLVSIVWLLWRVCTAVWAKP